MKLGILLLSLVFSFSAFSQVKVGIVNIQEVLTKIKEGDKVNKTLEKSFKAKQKLLRAEEEKIKKLDEKLKKQSAVLSEKARQKLAVQIQQGMMKAKQMQGQFQGEIRKQEADLKKPILEKLKPIIESISKAEGVALTFERSTSPIVYAASQVNITEKVIKAYDKKYAK